MKIKGWCELENRKRLVLVQVYEYKLDTGLRRVNINFLTTISRITPN